MSSNIPYQQVPPGAEEKIHHDVNYIKGITAVMAGAALTGHAFAKGTAHNRAVMTAKTVAGTGAMIYGARKLDRTHSALTKKAYPDVEV